MNFENTAFGAEPTPAQKLIVQTDPNINKKAAIYFAVAALCYYFILRKKKA